MAEKDAGHPVWDAAWEQARAALSATGGLDEQERLIADLTWALSRHENALLFGTLESPQEIAETLVADIVKARYAATLDVERLLADLAQSAYVIAEGESFDRLMRWVTSRAAYAATLGGGRASTNPDSGREAGDG